MIFSKYLIITLREIYNYFADYQTDTVVVKYFIYV